MPSNTVLISGSAVGAAQILIWSYSCVFLTPMSKAIRAGVFSFMGALSDFYIFHRHRVCLVDRVDLICSLYGWWEGFGSSSLATLPLGFSCGFISTSACQSSTGVCPWICPGGLGFDPVSARCGSGVAAWVTVNSSPRPGIAPQSLNSSSHLLCLPGRLPPCPGHVWLQQGLSDSHCI